MSTTYQLTIETDEDLDAMTSWALGVMSRDAPGGVSSWSLTAVGREIERCEHEGPYEGYTCSLPPGHPGKHAAYPTLDESSDVLDEWSDEDVSDDDDDDDDEDAS